MQPARQAVAHNVAASYGQGRPPLARSAAVPLDSATPETPTQTLRAHGGGVMVAP